MRSRDIRSRDMKSFGYPRHQPLFPELGGGGGYKTKEDILDLLKKIHDVAIYGVLLTRDIKHPLVQMLRERWYDFHKLTGPEFLLIVFEPPDEWRESFKNYWKGKLGEDIEKIWDEWQTGVEREGAVDYAKLFKPEVRVDDFPCMVLFTDLKHLDEQQVVIRKIPKWDTESLYKLLSGMIQSIVDCCEQSAEKRLECLKSSLTSPTAKTKAYYKYGEKRALYYLKKNPASIVATTAAFALALANANVLPIGAAAVAILQILKNKQK